MLSFFLPLPTIAPRSVKDRLEELKAQRRLVQSHLAWIDAEIRREKILAGSRSIQLSKPGEAAGTSRPAEFARAPTDAPKESAGMTENLEIDHGAIRSEVRRGCLLYLATGTVLALIVGALVYILYRS